MFLPSSQPKRIPSLDGLRAVSIGMVVFAHLTGTAGFPVTHRWSVLGDTGALGVRVFFVISGFLITKLLIQELNQSGAISLKRFYLRRTLRIFPAFYCYLAIMGLASALGVIFVPAGDLWKGALYLMNYARTRSWYVGHLWSLSVEEQFYLLWPATMCLFGRRSAMRAAGLLLALAPVSRMLIWYAFPDLRFGIGEFFPTIMDALATGCLLAGFEHTVASHPGYKRLSNSGAFFVVPTLVIITNALSTHAKFAFIIGDTIINLGIALCVLRCIETADGPLGRMLNSKPLVFVGGMSYSLYLWQQPFLNRSSHSGPGTFPLNLLLATVCACLSYFAVERPLLAHRFRIEALLLKRPRRLALANAHGD